MSPRVATTGLFVVNGAVIGAWVSQIPAIQREFDLSPGAVGLVLLCMSLAVILAVPVAGQLVARRGSAPVAVAGGFACVVAVNLPVLAPTVPLLAASLVLLGAASAAMDVAMNSHGVALETAGGTPIMSSLHAGWALGGVLGAAAGAAGAALGDGRARDRGAGVGGARRADRRLRPQPRPRLGGRGRRPRRGSRCPRAASRCSRRCACS